MKLITIADVAEELGISKNSVYMILYKGKMKRSGKKLGCQVLIDYREVERYRKDHPKRSTEELQKKRRRAKAII